MRNVVVTRVQCNGPPMRSRNLEERLMVRFPALYRGLATLGQRLLSPRSRVRRTLLRRQVVSGWTAWNRGDLKLILVRYAPDVEFEFGPGQQTLGLGGTFQGHEGMLDAFSKLGEGWDSVELEPAYILDMGDRVLNLGFIRARGPTSGVQLEEEFAQLLTAPKGLVVHDGPSGPMQWEDGLRATGLDPNAVSLPARERRVRP